MNFLRYYVLFDKKENFNKFEEVCVNLQQNVQGMGLQELVFNYFKEQGLEQGLEQGSEKTERKIVLNAHREGIPMNVIAKITGLSEDQIRAIIDAAKNGEH